MNIENSPPIEKAGEYAVDFTVAQLVETEPGFRDWLFKQFNPHSHIREYLGATIHVAYAGEGESDIEFGVETENGNRHLVMIENKIDAAKQPDQIERYYKRGEFRTTREDWNSFSVYLLAPDRYVDNTGEVDVDAVILYEEVLDYLEGLNHDSAAFFQSVFKSAMRKSLIADSSETLDAISKCVQEELVAYHLAKVQSGNKSLIFKSKNPAHHDAIGYNVYITEKGEGGWTKIRLKIMNVGGVSKSERDVIKSIVADHEESLPDYEWDLSRKTDIGAKTLWHDEIGPDEPNGNYVETIVDELANLVETLHPVFVDEQIKQ